MVENVVKHNSINEESPLHITIYIEDNYLIVSNNRNPRNRIEHSNKVGLLNLQALYNHLSDVPLQVIETEKEFTVKIPLL